MTACLLLGMVPVLAGCMNEDDLPDWADKSKLTTEAQAVIDDLTSGDYDSIAEKTVLSVKEQMTGATINGDDIEKKYEAQLKSLGAFESFGNTAVKKRLQLGIEYVQVQQEAKFKNGSATIAVSLTQGGSLVKLEFVE